MDNLIVVYLRTTKCNITIPEEKIGRWYFNWKNNILTAYTLTKYSSSLINEPFELLMRTDRLNLGLLIDALTMCVNLEINTSIAISTEINAKIFKISKKSRPKNLYDFFKLRSTLKLLTNVSIIGEEKPKRIDDSLTVNLTNQELSLMNKLLSLIKRKTSYSHIELKLMNYWRRGVDLDNLTYWDESFLAFYKILEYYEKRAKIRKKDIPKKYKTRSLQSAYKIAFGAGLKKLTHQEYKLLSTFVYLRNHWDIAHVKVNMLPNEREGAMYYTYHFSMWEYLDFLKEITRFFIFKQLGFKNLQLTKYGGLYKLNQTK